MELSFSRSNGPIDQIIARLIEESGGIHHPAVIKEMILATLKIGQDVDYLADLKLINRTLREMRYTALVFAPIATARKLPSLGRPARKKQMRCIRNAYASVAAWQKTTIWLLRGGPGIMQAGNEGAGSENSLP